MTPLCDIAALVLDCDGVLTDGRLYYSARGPELLSFFAADSLGLALWCKHGFPAAVLSGRPTDIAEARHRELGVAHFVGRCTDKAFGFTDVCRRMGVSQAVTAYVGDDIVDLPAMRLAGMAVAVAGAASEVLAAADWTTARPGGGGAVRDVIEAILQAKGIWPCDLIRVG